MRISLAFAAILAVFPQGVQAVSPTPSEMSEARRWAAAHFHGSQETDQAGIGLQVLANNDAVQVNGRHGRPLRIGDQQYTRGLYCHAVSKVLVRLPSPGKTFDAIVGVDNNEQTNVGKSSVVFSVTVAGKTAFTSELMRLETPAVPVQVDLGGATEFTLDVGDGGDGIGWDQCDWADARVVLADGQTLWLADLPVFGIGARTYGVEPFFSFVCDGKPSAELLKTWELKRASRPLDDRRMEHTLTYSDPTTGLVLRCVGIEYRDFPTVEWTLYFKNTSDKDSPILENIQALDAELELPPGVTAGPSHFCLHHHTGSICSPQDYQPHETILALNQEKRISGAGGRPTNSDLSYFNLQTTPSEGTIVVVGWPGQWAATFRRDKENGVHLVAGQELTHFKLLPGEEVRTPLVLLQFWKGDRIRSQNIWRRWMMAYGMPKPGGKLPPPQLAASSSRAYTEMTGANTENQIMHIDRYLEEGIKLDYWWMDAGWYACNGNWPQIGTWELDAARFPKGFRPISDHAHAKGAKIIVWFEPERVSANSWLTENHPEWVLGGKNGGLLNLGDPAAWQWLVNHIDRMITEQGIDLYRQDFNMDPLAAWRANDAPDRQGITEIKHVTGYLAYWDELIRRHPNLLIDTCASGGRRNDLETLRRSVPLWRSDYPFEPIGQQCQTYGLSCWAPYFGTGTVACSNAGYYGGGKTPIEPYAFWSNVAPGLTLGIDVRVRDLDYPALRRLIEQWKKMSACYYGDFYPLTPYSLDDRQWMAWQFDCPEKGEGAVQAFRRENSPYVSMRVKLQGLDPAAVYSVANVNADDATEVAGRELMDEGLVLAAKAQPDAIVILYRKKL